MHIIRIKIAGTPMNNRQINLNDVSNCLISLKAEQTPAVSGLLEKIRSEVLRIDQHANDILKKYNKHLISLNEDENSFARIEEKLNSEYQSIDHELETLVENIKQWYEEIFDQKFKASKSSSDLLSKLLLVCEDLLTMKNKRPTFNYTWDMKNLYSLCSALGGFSIKLGQGMLPTGGFNEESSPTSGSNAKLVTKIEFEGICCGMVLEWGRQSVLYGTCLYPISSTCEVLNKQQDQKKINATTYFKDPQVYLFAEIDFVEQFHGIADNVPYLVIMNEKASSHAIGIRKHKNHLEIFDPNYGYFFFRDIKSAATWISLLFQQYAASNFPCANITFSMYDAWNINNIPESKFPTATMLEQSCIQPYTEDGYKQLITGFKLHLIQMIDTDDTKKLIDLSLKAIMSINQHLCKVDSQRLVNIVTSLINPDQQASDEDRRFIFKNKKLYLKLKEAVKTNNNEATMKVLKETIQKLENTYLRSLPINQEVLATINKFETAVKDCNQRMYELATEMSDETRKGKKQDHAKIRSLKNTIDILNLKRKNLRRNNIGSKLVASVFGALNYSLEQANADIDTQLFNALDTNQLQPHLAVIEMIDSVSDGLTLCKDQFKQRNEKLDDYEPENLNIIDIRQHKINLIEQKLIKIANTQLNDLVWMRYRVVSENNLSTIHEEFIIKFGALLQCDAYGYMQWLNTALDSFNLNKYTFAQIHELRHMLQKVNVDSRISIMQPLLIAAEQYVADTALQEALHNLIKRVHKLTHDIIKAMDQTDKYKPKLSELQHELHEISATLEYITNPAPSVSIKKHTENNAFVAEAKAVAINSYIAGADKPVIAPSNTYSESTCKRKLYLVMAESAAVAEIKTTGLSIFKSTERVGRKYYSEGHILSRFNDYLKAGKNNNSNSCAYTTLEGANSYIEKLNLRGWEDGNRDKYKNESDYNGPDFAPFVFELECEVNNDKRDNYFIQHLNVAACHIIAAHLEGIIYPINKPLNKYIHLTLEEFKAEYTFSYTSKFFTDPKSSMKKMLETGEIISMSQVYAFADENPGSRTDIILKGLGLKQK
jgi:uncharacterized protein YoxC